MTTQQYESIFKDSNVKPNLNKLFSRPVKAKPALTKQDEEENLTANEIKKEEATVQVPRKKFDAEFESRTVFVGNLAVGCKKEELLKIFKPFGKIDSVRFRNIVPEDLTKSKKYAFITKQQHPNKQTINAFVRFKDKESAINASKEVNGMEYKSNHLRVDIASKSDRKPTDINKRSLFLGGIPFDVTDEEVYQHFSSCGPIDYVRVIRDNKTGIGKGFGYVAFKSDDTANLAIKLDGSMLKERKIRVTRCVKKQKTKKEEKVKTSNGRPKQPFKGKDNKREFKAKKPSEIASRPKKDFKKTNEFKKNTDTTIKPEIKKKQIAAKKNKKKIAKKRHVSTNNTKNSSRFKI